MLNRLTLSLLVFCLLPVLAEARLKTPAVTEYATPSVYEVAQRDGMSLNEAVESVRRRPEVERILSAETKVRNQREVHRVKAMTKNGTVKTYEVNGRRR
ncbi:MAG: hypothetical protein AAGE85_13795 [Pseudomonadota bacterium]